jgi:hypothetical protein
LEEQKKRDPEAHGYSLTPRFGFDKARGTEDGEDGIEILAVRDFR